MADNNKNPRRTIWLSETEPLSHYDIWLSKNQHLNSDGEPVSDNGVLRPCDYIFKVWDCGEWHPIIGLNSTAVNKINTVLNTGYTTTHNGHDINSSSYLEFHLPLFTSPNSSPLELFDAGTLGLAIKEYVTNTEWLQIFEGNNIDINTFIDPAESNKLGGIWADTFSIEDMFPDSEAHDSHSQTEINDSYNWITLAKYKLNHGTSDYNLYVNAKDVINIINNYVEANPDAPGIDFDFATTSTCGGIYSDTFSSPYDFAQATKFVPIECKFYPTADTYLQYWHRLCINAGDVIKEIHKYEYEEYQDTGEFSLIRPGFGLGMLFEIDRTLTIFLKAGVANYGKYLKIKSDGSDTEWVDIMHINGSEIPSGNTVDFISGDNITMLIGDSSSGVTQVILSASGIDTSGSTNGLVLTSDGSGNVYWLTIAGNDIYMSEINCSGKDVYIDVVNANRDGVRIINQHDDSDIIATLDEWNFYSLVNVKEFFGFNGNKNAGNPIYILIDEDTGWNIVTSGNTLNIIDESNCVSGHTISVSGSYLFTLQFNAIRIEKIQSVSNEPNEPNVE